MNEDIRNNIVAANRRFCENVRKGDAVGLAALYTEDGVVLPPNGDKIHGKNGIREFWGAVITQLGLKDAVLRTDELFGSGDTVTEVGSYTLKLQPAGQKPIEDKGKYIVVWRKTAEGWKLHRDIWNTSMPLPK